MNSDQELLPLIDVQDVALSVGFARQKTILFDINFTILPQTITTIIGPNGAGKSSLLRLLLRLIQPTRGNVRHCSGLRMGYMPQQLVLNSFMALSVETFLALYNSDETAALTEICQWVGVESLLKQSIHDLSGGEWQRVLLARALLNQPHVLILDEPAQGLDFNAQTQFYALLRHLSQKLSCAIVHVSHDLHLVWDESDHIICLNRHICCQGSPQTLADHPSLKLLFAGFVPYVHHHDHSHINNQIHPNDI